MSRIAKTVLIAVGVVVLIFAAGNLCGLYFYSQLFVDVEDHEDDAAHASDDHEDEHVALTRQAFENLQLQLGSASRGEYWESLTVPGEVIEIPGKSDLSVSAPVSGIVEQVLVLEGQALGPADPLCTMRITDDNLTKAQSELLATLSRQDVVRKEMARLAPLTESGTVSGQRKRDLEYELSQLDSTSATLRQEIRARGLPADALSDVVENKLLATKLMVSVPTFMRVPESLTTRPVSFTPPMEMKDFSIEQLYAHPGRSVQRGDDLCDLAYHAELYIRGQAFESDLPALAKIAEEDWTISAEFGHEHDAGHSHTQLLEGLRLRHVDNHVDRETQTFKFYLPLSNEVVKSTSDERNRMFQQWRFKPGQRVHLKLPVECWQHKLLLPREAVVVEGPDAVVFVEHVEEESGPDHDPDHAHEDIYIELEPVPVRLLHRDNRVAVIADDGQLSSEQRVALNCAYKLNLALKMQAAGGSGHHHHHDH